MTLEAALEVEDGPLRGHTFSISPGTFCFVGQAGSAVRLSGPGVEARHAAVRLTPEGLEVVDLGSRLGTLLDGVRLRPRAPAPLPSGSALTIGPHVLRAVVLGDDGRPLTAAAGPTDYGLPPGELEVLRELGRGAMGRVLLCRRRRDGAQVAVKVLVEPVEPGSVDHERFAREAAVGQRLASPHVVAVLEARVLGRRAFIVMEHVDGPSARDLVTRGPLPLPAAVTIAAHVAQALVVAAAAGVVHRDVKPANVLVARQGLAKLCDFGVAKDLGGAVRSLTRSGQGLGTLAYMAPELISEAKHVDARADVYGLGATLYHLASGRPPFEVKTFRELIATLERRPAALSDARPGCPEALSRLVDSTLALDLADRPPARALAGALEALLAAEWPGFELASALGAGP